ncbi:RICIN domain-containing protein [Allorhizocola rhizosphaerae]|uniref:RICIN domain-containing protein n=1 Tax=Allorhizocola rhizosphaerae TaxID=1872709 RepID=UPI000E3BEBCF|nr:RICIN domain-containing protein [Allorhizocola rhizosphaerae]
MNLKLARTATALAVFVAVLSPATSASADGEVDGPWYIVHSASGRCLDSPAEWGGVNGTPMQLWDCYPPTQYNQMWRRRWRSLTSFELINVASGRCLDAPAEFAGGDGTKIQVWDCYPPNQTNQMWRLMAGGRLQNVGFSKVIQPDPGRQNQNGTWLQSWNLDTSNFNQVWQLRSFS